ncbi:hypothetical protein PIB30_031126, partial [Stylosanthes scabra]|nr:hypothetical protein [Stylosanthes scabra]
MGSGVIYNEYEKREKFEYYDMKADVELGTFRIRRYHFDDESFVHPLHSVRSDPDRPYEIPIEALMADKPLSTSRDGKSSTRRCRSSRCPASHYSPRGISSTQQVPVSSLTNEASSSRNVVASKTLRMPKSWELIPSSEGWTCEGDEDKEIRGMKPSVEKKEVVRKTRKRRKISRKRFLLLLLYLWRSMLLRTTCSSPRSWSDIPNILLSIGAEIFKRALNYPARMISKNAGVNGDIVIEKVLSDDNMNFGYNASKDHYEDLMKAGIMDPTKVVRCCIEHAASVAKAFLTSNAVVIERKEIQSIPRINPMVAAS